MNIIKNISICQSNAKRANTNIREVGRVNALNSTRVEYMKSNNSDEVANKKNSNSNDAKGNILFGKVAIHIYMHD